MAAGDCYESTAYERLGYLYRLSLLNRPQIETDRFVFHSLIRLFAQELAVERSLQEDAAARHGRFFTEFVKSSDVNDTTVASILAEELDDIILAAQWLQRQEIADYEVIIRLGPFLQQYGHWQQAVALMSGFLSLAEHFEDWSAIVQLRIQQAKYLSLLGQFSRAEEVLAPIAGIVDRIETQAVRKRCTAMWLNTLGGALQRLGRFGDARDAFERSYLLVEQGDQHGQAVVLNSLGGVLQRQGHFDDAVDAFQRSYDISEELGDERSLSMVLNSLGGVLQDLGHFDDAADAFKRSVRIGEELGDIRHVAVSLNSLGGVLQDLGHFDDAVDAFKRSVRIGEELGDIRHVAIALNSLGGVLQRLGQFDDAADAFQRSYDISEELGDQRSLAMVLNSLGGALQRLGRLDEALDCFQRSVQIGEKLGDRLHLAMVHLAMGNALLSRGDIEEGAIELGKSFEINVSLRNRRGLGTVTPVLTQALMDLGRHSEALVCCQRALAIAPKNRRLLELHDQLSLPHRAVLKQGSVKHIIQHPQGHLYGFITPDDGSRDVYFREGYVDPEILPKLATGVRVEVEVEQGAMGPRARNIKVIS